MMNVIPLSEPDITDLEIEAVVDALRAPRLSIGPRQARFEEMVAERAGRRHGVAVSSGTAALHTVLVALGVGPGDEVITTPFSFIASANPILYVGATPVFVDIDPLSLNMDPELVQAKITPRTKAIIGVEVFGNPKHMDRLAQIAHQNEISLIEDACEAIGGAYRGQPVGSFGRASVFGFYPNKQITTGEGGMIVTDDHRLAEICRCLRNQGRADCPGDPDPMVQHRVGSNLSFERLGFNYRLSEIAAALGIAQMERLPAILDARREAAAIYMSQLMDCEDIVLPNVEASFAVAMSWSFFVIRLASNYGLAERNRVIAGLLRHDIGAGNFFPCIHMQPFYRERFGFASGNFPIAESIADRTIALPFYTRIDATTIELVVQTLKLMISREKLLSRDS